MGVGRDYVVGVRLRSAFRSRSGGMAVREVRFQMGPWADCAGTFFVCHPGPRAGIQRSVGFWVPDITHCVRDSGTTKEGGRDDKNFKELPNRCDDKVFFSIVIPSSSSVILFLSCLMGATSI